jgi:Xaa-Pro aminopeptidase
MFSKDVYLNRRKKLKEMMNSGIGFFPGNVEIPFNYRANPYYFRQDSSFLYYFGIDRPDLAAIIDFETGNEILFGNDFDIEDIIWMGVQPSMDEWAEKSGVALHLHLAELPNVFRSFLNRSIDIHYLPVYHNHSAILLSELSGKSIAESKNGASEKLIRAVVAMAEIKDDLEIAEIERAVDITRLMHITSMRMAQPGRIEQEIAGTIEGIAKAYGGHVSFPVILSSNGHILHNHHHNNILQSGRMMVTDAGAETNMHYAGDITRTVPVGGKFNARQRDIYQIVLDANMAVIQNSRPNLMYKEMHLLAASIITDGLKNLGIMKGSTQDAVAAGAHALFMPHGLGHQMGLDVHDMEGLGENFVGYDETVNRSEQFGLAYLRMAKKLKPGHVITDEPGIYFIPELFKLWKKENKHAAFINFDEAKKFLDFGGVRIEDDILITENACRVLGKAIPKTVAEIEETMRDIL